MRKSALPLFTLSATLAAKRIRKYLPNTLLALACALLRKSTKGLGYEVLGTPTNNAFKLPRLDTSYIPYGLAICSGLPMYVLPELTPLNLFFINVRLGLPY